MVILTFICSIVIGLAAPAGIYINQNIFDGGLTGARNEMAFSDYSVFLVLFVTAAILPSVIGGFVYNYVEPRSLLILRTAYKSRMLKTMKYEHFQSESSAEIIDKVLTAAR